MGAPCPPTAASRSRCSAPSWRRRTTRPSTSSSRTSRDPTSTHHDPTRGMTMSTDNQSGESGEIVNGTLFQGSDGAIYFIPADRLEEFRVPEDASATARRSFESMESEVAGFGMANFGLMPGIATLPAFEGPLGVVDRSVLHKTKTMYQLPGNY